jgi:hypothetical protein
MNSNAPAAAAAAGPETAQQRQERRAAAALAAGPGTAQQQQQHQAAAAADNELDILIQPPVISPVTPPGVFRANPGRAAARAPDPLHRQLQQEREPQQPHPFIPMMMRSIAPANGGQKKKQTSKNSKKYKNKKYKNKNRKHRQTRKTKKGKM